MLREEDITEEKLEIVANLYAETKDFIDNEYLNYLFATMIDKQKGEGFLEEFLELDMNWQIEKLLQESGYYVDIVEDEYTTFIVLKDDNDVVVDFVFIFNNMRGFFGRSN